MVMFHKHSVVIIVGLCFSILMEEAYMKYYQMQQKCYHGRRELACL